MIPDHIRPALRHTQANDIQRHVPMLMAVAALNTGIVMAVCAHRGFAVQSYGWMTILILYCTGRIFFNRRSAGRDGNENRTVIVSAIMAVVMMAMLGATASYTYAVGTFDRETLIPVSLVCGAMAIAHCLYALRLAALGVLAIGILPVALTMTFAGDFRGSMLGFAFLSVVALMIRFVAAQSGQLVQNLLLQHQIRLLADTDALTGLANRRAMLAALDNEVSSENAFAVALIDLDGFKQVNDRLGHHAGDLLLCEVGKRLRAAADCGDEVGRLGGDEFVALFRGVGSETEAAARANAMLAALCRPIEVDGKRPKFGASLGFAVKILHGNSVQELLHSADQALYSAKRGVRHGHKAPRTARLAA